MKAGWPRSNAIVRALVAAMLLLALIPSVTTTASATTLIYDERSTARVDAQEVYVVEAASPLVNGPQEVSADLSVPVRGTSTTPSRSFLATEAAGGVPTPTQGQTVYRFYGGDSAAGGASWSPTNPGSVGNYRNAAGLPSGGASGATNTGNSSLRARSQTQARSSLPGAHYHSME